MAMGDAAEKRLFAPWMLRFPDPERERRFLASRRQRLQSSIARFTAAAVLVLSCPLVLVITDWHGSGFCFKLGLGMELCILRNAVVIGLVLTGVAALISAKTFFSRLSCVALEGILMVLGCLLATSAPFLHPWYVAKIQGEDPLMVLANPAESSNDACLLLPLLVVVGLTHSNVPVRWSMLWPLEFLTISCYGLAALGLGGPMNLVPSLLNLFVLCVLVVTFSIGKRASEVHERETFVLLVSEAEWVVSTTLDQKLDWPTPGATDQAVMDATTSVQTFSKETPGGGGSAERLDQIVTLGSAEHWLLPRSALQVDREKVLGCGKFGMVVAGRCQGAAVAIKLAHNASQSSSLEAIAHELRLLRHVRHPNIITFYGACADTLTGELMLVLERLYGRTLDVFVSTPPSWDDVSLRCKLALDVSCALRFLHSHQPQIVHGDLSGSNITVETHLSQPLAKLIDFGLARLMTTRGEKMGGTLQYMAPETFNEGGAPPAPNIDVFAFGRILFLIMAGRRPLQGRRPSALKAAARNGIIPDLAWPRGIPLREESKALCSMCLRVDPPQRPGMQQVQQMLYQWQRLVALGGDDDTVAQVARERAEHLDLFEPVRAPCHQPADADVGRAEAADRAAAPLGTVEEKEEASLMCAHFAATPEDIKDSSMIRMLRGWNIAIGAQACCPFHAALEDLGSVHKRLSSKPCDPEFQPFASWQCPRCKMLMDCAETGRSACSLCSPERIAAEPQLPHDAQPSQGLHLVGL